MSSSERTADHSTIWLDLSELASWTGEVTGIQRVVASVATEFLKLSVRDEKIRFCKLIPELGFVALPPETTERYLKVFFGDQRLQERDLANRRHTRPKSYARDILRKLYHSFSRATQVGTSSRGFAAYVQRRARKIEGPVLRLALQPNKIFRDNDVLLSLGAVWRYPDYPLHVAAIREKTKLLHVLMLHDVIPFKLPHLFSEELVARFRSFIRGTIPTTDKLLVTSNCTRSDVRALEEELGFPNKPIDVVGLGSPCSEKALFKLPDEVMRSTAGFVLCVSTVEVRKNHRLLVRTWQRMLERHSPACTPHLVWAGREGWLIEDLLEELHISNFLGGKLIWLGRERGVSDATLGALYRDCLFTIFPSFYEGWGLPVSESLARGKFCLASNAGPLPEVGGTFVDYFSPDDPAECLAVTERAIFDSAYRARREEHIRQQFRSTSWLECATRLLTACREGC